MEDNWQFNHMAVIVKDITKVAKQYEYLGGTLGIPRFPSEFFLDSRKYQEYEVYGKTPETVHLTKVLFVNMNALLIELMQPIEGETLYREFLDNKGEGFHHIDFHVDNLEIEQAKLIKKGFPVITRVKFPHGSTIAYFDTSKAFNFIIELTQVSKQK